MRAWTKRMGAALLGLAVSAAVVAVAPQPAMASTSTVANCEGVYTVHTSRVYFSGAGAASRIYWSVNLPFGNLSWKIERYVTGYFDPIVAQGSLGPVTDGGLSDGGSISVPQAAYYYMEVSCAFVGYGVIGY